MPSVVVARADVFARRSRLMLSLAALARRSYSTSLFFYIAPSAAAALFTAPCLTQSRAPYRPIPAHTPVTAVTLIFAAPSRAMMPANAPTRSSPSMRKAVFGFDNLIFAPFAAAVNNAASDGTKSTCALRSEEHTSELQSLAYLVCRLLLEKKKH